MKIEGADSELELVNIALSNAGYDRIVDFEQTNSSIAVYAKSIYPICRISILEIFPWNAPKRYKKVPKEVEPEFHPNFENAYKIPSDCLKIRDIHSLDHFGWERMGGFIFTNLCDHIILEYTTDLEDLRQFDAALREALIFKLSANFCLQKQDEEKAFRYFKLANNIIEKAKIEDQNTGNKQPLQVKNSRMSQIAGNR